MLIVIAALLLEGTQDAEKKLAVPDAATLKNAEKLIREIFKDEYARKTVPERTSFAKKLLEQGLETKDDPAARFVLLRDAIDLASELGLADLALKGIDAQARSFAVDGFAAKHAALQTMAKGNRPAADLKALALLELELSEQAAEQEQFETAAQAATAAGALARRAKEIALISTADARTKEIGELRSDFTKAEGAREKLGVNPSDPHANGALGRYLGLTKGKWDQAIPLLAKGEDPALKALAERDSRRPSEVSEQVSLGDAWWDAGEKATGRKQLNLRLRAGYWYQLSLGQASGLTKVRIEKRLLESGRILGDGPRDAKDSSIGLLPLIQPDKDIIKGTWEVGRDGLQTPLAGQGILQIPYLPPEEYDLRLVVHLASTAEVNLGLAVGQTHFVVPIDGWYGTCSGIELMDGKYSNANEAARKGRFLKNNVPNTIVCSVRKESIRLLVNGEEILNWKADYRRLSLTPYWSRPQNGTLGLGCLNGYRITELTLVPVSGQGRALR